MHLSKKAWFCKIACSSKLSTPTCKHFYTDLSAKSVTFRNSASHLKSDQMTKSGPLSQSLDIPLLLPAEINISQLQGEIEFNTFLFDKPYNWCI